MRFFNENKKIILTSIKLVIFGILLYLFFCILAKYFIPFIIGYILCIILYPMFRFFDKLKIPKILNSIICIVISTLIVSFIGVGIVGQIIKEGKELYKEIPYYIEQISNTFDSLQTKSNDILAILPDSLKKVFDTLYENSKIFLGEFLGNGLTNSSVSIIKKIPDFFMIVILGIISCFLFLIDKENIDNFVLRQIPRKYIDNFNIVKTHILETIIGYIKAQLIIMSLISTIVFIGLNIIKAPYALFIAVVIGIIDALPVFGGGFILWPWSIYNLIIGNYSMSVNLIIIYIVILIARQFLEPKILGKQIGIHPLITLMSIYIGLKVFGILGFIIGPSIVVIIKALQNENILWKWK